MSFNVLQKLKDRVGQSVYDQLTDLTGGVTGNDAIGQARLDAAYAVLVGELAKRYDAAALIAAASADENLAATLATHELSIAAWKLYAEHPDQPEVRKKVRDEYDEAFKWIASIVSGEALPSATPIPETTAGVGAVAIGEPRVMKAKTLGNIF